MMRNETANDWYEMARTGLKQIERIIVTVTKTRTRLSKLLAFGIIETSVTLLKDCCIIKQIVKTYGKYAWVNCEIKFGAR